MIRRSQALVLACVVGTLVLLAGTAFAYWKTSGAGTGSAISGQNVNITAQPIVTGPATVTSRLVPGGSADLVVSLTNPNPFAVTITGISQNGAITVTDGGACNAATAGVSVPTSSTLSVAVAANSSGLVHLAGAVVMSDSSDNGCQGKFFAIPVTLKVSK